MSSRRKLTAHFALVVPTLERRPRLALRLGL